MQNTFNRLDVRLHGPNTQALIGKLRTTEVQPTGCGPIQERISGNLESRLHSYPSARPQLLSGCHLEKTKLDAI
jgi:hypothetical protein